MTQQNKKDLSSFSRRNTKEGYVQPTLTACRKQQGKGKAYKEVRRATEQPINFLAGGLQFTSGGTEQIKDTGVVDTKTSKTYPKREEFQWRPAPLLCKRFDLPDPFMGKPPSAPRARNKMDSLIFLPDTVKAATGSARKDSDTQDSKKETSVEEPEVEVKAERPVDLLSAFLRRIHLEIILEPT